MRHGSLVQSGAIASARAVRRLRQRDLLRPWKSHAITSGQTEDCGAGQGSAARHGSEGLQEAWLEEEEEIMP
jgi:hypothetical protein